MAKITCVIGGLLVLLGLGAYLGTGTKSITAMIPTFFGIPVLLAGLIALKETWRIYAVRAALFFTFLGFVGGLRGLSGLFKMLSGATVNKPNAVYVQLTLSLLCLLHLIFAIRSFLQAKRDTHILS